VRLLIYNLQFAIKKFLSPLRGREGRREGVIAFKFPLAFLHPLPYPSPIKGRGEIKKIFHFYLSLFKREIKRDFSIFIITFHN